MQRTRKTDPQPDQGENNLPRAFAAQSLTLAAVAVAALLFLLTHKRRRQTHVYDLVVPNSDTERLAAWLDIIQQWEENGVNQNLIDRLSALADRLSAKIAEQEAEQASHQR